MASEQPNDKSDAEEVEIFDEKFCSEKKVFMVPAVYSTQQKPGRKKGRALRNTEGCHMPEEKVKAAGCDDREKGEKAEKMVIAVCKSILNNRLVQEDSSCFILHNCKIHVKEVDIIIVHRYLGLILMEVKSCKTISTLKKAREQLEKAKDFLRNALKDRRHDLPIKMAAVFPNSPTGSEDEGDIWLLSGNSEEIYMEFFRNISLHVPQSWKDEVSFKRAVNRLTVHAFRLETYERCTVKSFQDYDCWWLSKEQVTIMNKREDFLHIHGPHGVGKSILLILKAREWLKEDLTVLVLVGFKNYDPLLIRLGHEIYDPNPKPDRVILGRIGQDDIEAKIEHATGKVAIIADEYAGDEYEKIRPFMNQKKVVAMWSAFTADLPDDINVHRARLTNCIRCPPHVVEILDTIDPGNPVQCDTEIPRHEVLDMEPTLIFHEPGDNSPHSSDFYDCETCKRMMKCAFRKLNLPLRQDSNNPGMSKSEGQPDENHLEWKHVVILLSDWIDHPEDVDKLENFFSDIGVPAVWERPMETERESEVLLPDRNDQRRGYIESTEEKGSEGGVNFPRDQNQGKRPHPGTPTTTSAFSSQKKLRGDDSTAEGINISSTSTLLGTLQVQGGAGKLEAGDETGLGHPQHQQSWREGMLKGEDRKGNPAVHFVRGLDFQGLEKCVVVVVHHNWRDLHPEEQTEEKIKERLENDRKNWYRSVSRCQCELILFSATPSPLCRDLKKQAAESSACFSQCSSV